MSESRFTYIVNPRRPIRGISDMPVIKSSKTLKLTKEEVLIAMKCGPVYRKFANEGIQERVDGANIDRLHNEKFISEREYSGTSIPVVKNNTVNADNTAVETPQMESIEDTVENEAPENTASELAVEESEEEPAVENEVTGEVSSIEAQNVEEDTDENDTEEVETSEEVEEDSDSVATDNVNSEEKETNGNNQHIVADYNGNRKKKKHRN